MIDANDEEYDIKNIDRNVFILPSLRTRPASI